jgi:hypothetical protein
MNYEKTDRIVIDRATTADKLRPMRATRLCFVVLSGLIAACSRGDRTGGSRDSGKSSDSLAAARSTANWVAGARPMILVPAHSNDRALVVLADSTGPQMEEGVLGDAELLQLGGGVLPVRVTVGTGTEGCVEAAIDPAPATAWGAGFVGGSIKPVPVDSIGSIPRSDSTSLTRAMFRMSSAIPNAKGGRFAGLPFSLVSLWRFHTPDGSLAVVGVTKRQINQEDSPLEERTLIVAEGASPDSLDLVYSSRSAGAEETIDSSELLAVLQTSPSAALDLVIAHDFGGASSYGLIERSGPKQWRLRWASRKFTC